MRGLRIVIAEDNWFVAEQLRDEQGSLGHTVVALARTGAELMDQVAREHPDLALIDVRLAGGSDGLAAAIEVQGKPYTSASLQAVLDGATEWLDSGSPRPFLSR